MRMSDAERAIREKYLNDTPTTPRYGPDVAYAQQLPHSRHPRPYPGIGPSNNQLRPWIFPPGMPSTPPLVRSTPTTPTESTHVYRLPQTHVGNTAAVAAAAAAAHQRQLYDVNMPHSSLNTVNNPAQKHLLHDPAAASARQLIPSALRNRAHNSTTGNNFSGRYQITTPSSSFPLDHPPHQLMSKYSPPSKHRRVHSPNIGIPSKEEQAMQYYGANERKESYRDSQILDAHQHAQYNMYSQYKERVYKEEMARATNTHALPDDNRNLPDRSEGAMRGSLPPPAIPIYPHKNIAHNQTKASYSGSCNDDDTFTSPPPLRQNSTSPMSLPKTFQTMPPPTPLHSSTLDSQSSLRSSLKSSSSQPGCGPSKNEEKADLNDDNMYARKRHHSDERNERHREMNVPVNLDGISNPYSKCVTEKEEEKPSYSSNNTLNTKIDNDLADNTKGTIVESKDEEDSYHSSLNSKHRLHHATIWREEESFSTSDERRCIETSRHEETSSSTDSTPQDTKNTNEQESSNYPTHFRAGSLIQLSNGSLRPVEDLNTDDFIKSAELSNEVQIDQSVVVSITPSKEKGSVMLGFSVGKDEVQVAVEAAVEHPFYVFDQGWSSVSPKDTMIRYRLACKELKLGDLCISLTHRDAQSVSSPNNLDEHIKEEISSPPISEMPKLQPINFNQDSGSCESPNSGSNEGLIQFSGDENDDKNYSSPSSSRRVSPMISSGPRSNTPTISTLKLLSSHYPRSSDKDSPGLKEGAMMKPPPPPDGIDSLKRRRSTSLSPSLTRNKSPDIFSNNYPVAQNMKERQVAFSDNVISHSPPLSPSSDDNAQVEDEDEEEVKVEQKEKSRLNDNDHVKEEQITNDQRNFFHEQLESHCDEFLSQNISNTSQSSNGHRNKRYLLSENFKRSSDRSESTNLAYRNTEESGGRLTSKVRKRNSSPYDEQAISSENKDDIDKGRRKKSLQSIFPNSGKEHSFENNQKDTHKHRTEKQGEETKHSNITDEKIDRTSNRRFLSQNTSPRNHQTEKDQIDPYNYMLESPQNEPDEASESKASTHRKNISYREDNDGGEGIDIEGISVRKRNMVRQT